MYGSGWWPSTSQGTGPVAEMLCVRMQGVGLCHPVGASQCKSGKQCQQQYRIFLHAGWRLLGSRVSSRNAFASMQSVGWWPVQARQVVPAAREVLLACKVAAVEAAKLRHQSLCHQLQSHQQLPPGHSAPACLPVYVPIIRRCCRWMPPWCVCWLPAA